MKVHPVADLFPMMSEAELADLAADIKANGQIQPIIYALIDDEDVLVDGRNRERACEIAGVEPWREKLNGQDPVAYILSSNDRRDLTQGQRAIVAAMANSYKLYEFGDIEKLGRALKVPRPRVAEAIVIVKHAPDLADQVRRGDHPFQPALERARQNKNDADANAAKMERLRAEAPDLAELADGASLDDAIKKLDERNAEAALLKTIEDSAPDLVERVDAGQITVTEALAIAHDREEKKHAAEVGATEWLFRVVSFFHDGDPKQIAENLISNFRTQYWPPQHEPLTADRLDHCATVLDHCAMIMGERNDERSTPN
jgi:hypothetical protein